MYRWTYRRGLGAIGVMVAAAVCVATAGGGTRAVNAAGSVSVVAHRGGVVEAVEAASDLLLVGEGAELVVYTPDGAQRLGGLLLPALIADIARDGSTAYVAARDGLYVVDVTSATEPTLLRREAAPPLDEFGRVSAVAAADGFAYVGLADDGLWVVDLTGATPGTHVVQAPDDHFVSELYWFGTLLFSVDNASGTPGQPQVWEVSTPGAPVSLGRVNTRDDASGVAAAGGHLFVSTFFEGMAIYAWDPAQPLAATLVGHLAVGTGAFEVALTGDGQRVVLATEAELVVADVSNRAAPWVTVARAAPVGYATRLTSHDGVLFATGGEAGLSATAWEGNGLTLEREIGMRGALLAGTRLGSDVYAAANTQGLLKLSAADPSQPLVSGRAPTGGLAQTVAANDSHVVVGASDEVIVLEAGSLTETGRVTLPDFNQAWGLAVAGETAYVAAGYAGVCAVGVNGGLPKLYACLDTDGEALDVVVEGTRLYVADSGNGVVVVDTTDPEHMQTLGRYADVFALETALVGTQLYVSDFNNGDGRLLLLERGDGAALTLAGQYDTRGFVDDLDTAGDLVYAANQEGLEVLQRLSATSLGEWAWYESAGGASEVVLAGGLAYLMDSVNGLVVLEVSQPGEVPATEPGAVYEVRLPVVSNW